MPWLKTELEKRGFIVIAPVFPTPEGQTLDNWSAVVNEHLAKLDNDSVIVGHSIGATFVLSVLEQLPAPVAATALVAGFTHDLDNDTFDAINHTFYQKQFDWDTIRQNAGQVSVLHGDNDSYVPIREAHTLAQKLAVEPILIPGGGHLNAEAGFSEFPRLLELLAVSELDP